MQARKIQCTILKFVQLLLQFLIIINQDATFWSLMRFLRHWLCRRIWASVGHWVSHTSCISRRLHCFTDSRSVMPLYHSHYALLDHEFIVKYYGIDAVIVSVCQSVLRSCQLWDKWASDSLKISLQKCWPEATLPVWEFTITKQAIWTNTKNYDDKWFG